MLNWIGEKRDDTRLKAAWKGIDEAVDAVLGEGKIRTPDLKGDDGTSQFGTAVAEAIRSN